MLSPLCDSHLHDGVQCAEAQHGVDDVHAVVAVHDLAVSNALQLIKRPEQQQQQQQRNN
jgi:hypothetical protein